MYKVVLLSKAEKAFTKADAQTAKKLAKAFKILERDPLRHPNVKSLVGPLKGMYRFRAGDFRIIYTVDAASDTVYVIRIADRKEAYE
jgi:mRNA interferase RelE/StbE